MPAPPSSVARRTLSVLPDAARLLAWQAQALGDEGGEACRVVSLEDAWTLEALVERLAGPGARGQVSALRLRAEVVVHGQPLAAALEIPGLSFELAFDVAALLSHLAGEGLSPHELARLGHDVPHLSSRLRALAEVWTRVEAALQRAGLRLGGPEDAAARALQGAWPTALAPYRRLALRWLHGLSTARLRVLDALAAACHRHGVALELRFFGSGQAAVDLCQDAALRFAESRWAALDVELSVEDVPSPFSALAPALLSFSPPPPGAAWAGPALSCFSAATPDDEARAVAARVRRLVERGVPPQDICLTGRGVLDELPRLAAALAEAGVPCAAPRGTTLADTPLGRTALALVPLVSQGFPVRELALLLRSPCAPAVQVKHVEPRRVLALAGARDDVTGTAGRGGALAARLQALEARADVPGLGAVRAAVDTATAALRALPEEAPAQALLSSFQAAARRLGLLDRPRPPSPGPSKERVSAAEAASVRAESARLSLQGLLEELQSAVEASGLARVPITREGFGRWLRLEASVAPVRLQGAAAGGVAVVDVASLAGQRFAHVFLVRADDGRLPGPPPRPPFFSDQDWAALNAAAGRPLLRLAVRDGEATVPAGEAEDRLLLHAACCAARQSLTFSHPRQDARGQALLPSPFVESLERLRGPASSVALPRWAPPPLDDVCTTAALRARVALEVGAPPATRQSRREPRAGLLASAHGHEAWLREALRAGAAEHQRLLFFSDEALPPGPFTGKLDAAPALAVVAASLEASAEKPLSAADLRDWATCGFRGLARRALRLREADEAALELDGRQRGTFQHDVLRRLVQGPSEGEASARVASAVARAADEWSRAQHQGHPALFSIELRRATRHLVRLLESGRFWPFGPAREHHAEVHFGSPRASPALRTVRLPGAAPGEAEVHLQGTIDRVDVLDGAVAVLDYKSSVKATTLDTDFQLPLYAFAALQAWPGALADAAWMGLRKLEVVKYQASWPSLLDVTAQGRAAAAAGGSPNLANAVFSLLARRKGGDAAPRPADCGSCELKRVCRITERRLEEVA